MHKWYQVASDFVEEKTHQVEEHQKSLLYKIKTHVEALKYLKDEVAGFKWGAQ